jgi:poly(3-hydroxybutyrate) depolymerase
MRKHPRTLLIALLTVAAILGLLVASACGEEKPTGTMTELKLTGEAGGTATAYVYSPTNPDFPGTVMPITFVYPDKTVASADEALKYLVKTGIKDILEKNRTFGMVFTPIDTAGYTEADLQVMNAAKGKFADIGFVYKGTTQVQGLVVGTEGTLYAGSRFRNYVFADGAGADFIAKYATKSMPYILRYEDGGSITFNHLVAAVALFNVTEKAAPGETPNPIPAYIAGGGEGVVDSFKAINGDKYPTVSAEAKNDITPKQAQEAWAVMSEWQRTEATPGIFVMTKYITDYKAAGLAYTEHLWSPVPEIGNDYKYTYFTWAPTKAAEGGAKRPAIMLFHGGNNSALYIAQTSDWLRVALENNMVVISVQHSGVQDETGAEIPAATATEIKKLLDYLITVEGLNIDPTKVYASGFSMGSMMTASLAKEYPTSFAGFGPCNPAGPMESGGVVAPVFAVGGMTDPLAKPTLPRSLGATNVQISLTNNGGTPDPTVVPEDNKTWKDSIFGYAADSTQTETRDACVYTINSYKSTDGNVYTMYASVTNMSHETLPYTSWFQWEFLKHFSRNADGSITYTP